MAGKARTELILGFHSVSEALKAGVRTFHAVYIADSRSAKRGQKIVDMAEKKGIPVKTLPMKKLDEMAKAPIHQGIIASVSPFPLMSANRIMEDLERQKTPFLILVLENIEDPHNLGALIRTALCTGVDYIMVPKDRAALPSPTVSRASAGAMEHARICPITNTRTTLLELKQLGAWVAGLDAAGKQDLAQADLTGNMVLVVGGEHKGIRPLVRKECDFLVSIPISGPVNSLNASVAAGMAMYEALRQRNK
ncbi:MAG: 23S rRNA (guanosine(2251)-2'-O)-methyltransferase RlmB [Desulfobacterales bacterium]|nr:23S rRNA (guanosine(2251)-2'-O)-methyltransferase RlmB [Desulfobacterales bacterium]